MPGKIIHLKCSHCEAHYQFQFGGDIRNYKDRSEYDLVSPALRNEEKLNPTEKIQEVFEFGVRQCPRCFDLIQTHHIKVQDESGNAQESKTETKCLVCGSGTREVDPFREDITLLRCPNCKAPSLVEDESGSILWD